MRHEPGRVVLHFLKQARVAVGLLLTHLYFLDKLFVFIMSTGPFLNILKTFHVIFEPIPLCRALDELFERACRVLSLVATLDALELAV